MHAEEDHQAGVDAAFDGADAGRAHFDLLIGADGLRSRVRTLLLGEIPLLYSGTTCWRGLVKNPGFDRAIEAWAGAARIGVVPLPNEELYFFLVLASAQGARELTWPEGFERAFAALPALAQPIFRVLEKKPPLHHDLEELPEPLWGQGRVLLMGDAAHAMTPNQGQGAAMAIEDALVLTRVLGEGEGDCLARYVALRDRRVRRVQLDSRRIGAVAHWRHPLAQTLRNGAMRLVPEWAGVRQYRRVVEPGLGLALG